ncbi:TPA: hypothetical protein ACH3X2_001790 [Trebouxia sp. C0005]
MHENQSQTQKPVAACSLELPNRCPVEGVHVPLPHVIQQHSPFSLHPNNERPQLGWMQSRELSPIKGTCSQDGGTCAPTVLPYA